MQLFAPLSLLVIVGALLPTAARPESTRHPEPAANLRDAVRSGRLLLNLRPRHERVVQEGRGDESDALTLRTLLGWETQPFKHIVAALQAINVAHLVDDFNDDPARNATAPRPLVPDPEYTGLNQLYVDFRGLPAARLRAGRQVVRLANNRLIANGEFRQIMQVFDAFSAVAQPASALDLNYVHAWGVRNTLGERTSTRLDLLHADYRYAPDASASLYGYFQDQPRTGSATGFTDNSNRILGLRVDGAWPLSRTGKLTYTAEQGWQDAYSDGNPLIDAAYSRVGLGGWWPQVHFRVDYERLSSNAGRYGFQTPLGNNHLYQGWSDQFASTPPQGIREFYVFLGGKQGHWHWHTEYHRYRSDHGDLDLGREFDAGILHEFSRHWLVRLEYADYRRGVAIAGPVRPRDTRKFWITLIYDFGGFAPNSRPFER